MGAIGDLFAFSEVKNNDGGTTDYCSNEIKFYNSKIKNNGDGEIGYYNDEIRYCNNEIKNNGEMCIWIQMRL